MSTNHIAAIHVLKSQLQLSRDDYTALLFGLTGKSSSKDMSHGERTKVRDHMQALAERLGLARPTHHRPMTTAQFNKSKSSVSAREKKVWALWHQLHRDGRIDNPSQAALNQWVERTVKVSALRFCNVDQLNTCIESLKSWLQRA